MNTRHLINGLMLAGTTIISLGAQAVPASAQPPAGYSAIGDYNGDGLADIADHWGATGSFWIRRNLGNGSFEAPGTAWGSGTTAAPLGTWRTLSADFTGDGLTDYADYHPASGQIWIHRNLGTGAFDTATWGFGTIPANSPVIAGDINGDGRADLLDVSAISTYTYYQNVGAGGSTFAAGVSTVWVAQFPPLSATRRPVLADVNADGCDDLIVSDTSTHVFDMYRSFCPVGLFGFNPSSTNMVSAFSHPSFTTVFGDFTGDGYADYADVNRDTGEIWVHRNLGGGFTGNLFDTANWAYGLYSSTLGFSILGLPVTFF